MWFKGGAKNDKMTKDDLVIISTDWHQDQIFTEVTAQSAKHTQWNAKSVFYGEGGGGGGWAT